MPAKTLARRIRDLGPGFVRFEELDPAARVSNVFQPQNPNDPHLDVLIQVPDLSRWQNMNSHYHSANLVPAPQGSPTLVDAVGKYFMRLFVPSQNI